MNSRLNVLIPDGASTWALSVIQCLSEIKNYKLFVLSNKKRTATKFSKYTSYYKYHERHDDTNWLHIINSEIESNAIDIIVPIAEEELSFFIRYASKISKSTKIIPLPKYDDFQIAINKHKLSVFAYEHGLPHPKSLYLNTRNEKQALLNDIKFPVLIKPLTRKGGDGIIKINSIEDFEAHQKQNDGPYFIQEFIEGYDIDCSVLCLNGEILTHTIQKGNLKGHNDFAPQLGFDFLKNESLLNIVKDIMSALNWSGVAHLDMRFDKHTKTFKLIEINARFWGSVEASKIAGVNFPHLAIQLALNNSITTHNYETVSYIRLKGVLKMIKRNPSFILKWKYLQNNTETKSFLNDPLPILYKFREWFGRQF